MVGLHEVQWTYVLLEGDEVLCIVRHQAWDTHWS